MKTGTALAVGLVGLVVILASVYVLESPQRTTITSTTYPTSFSGSIVTGPTITSRTTNLGSSTTSGGATSQQGVAETITRTITTTVNYPAGTTTVTKCSGTATVTITTVEPTNAQATVTTTVTSTTTNYGSTTTNTNCVSTTTTTTVTQGGG